MRMIRGNEERNVPKEKIELMKRKGFKPLGEVKNSKDDTSDNLNDTGNDGSENEKSDGNQGDGKGNGETDISKLKVPELKELAKEMEIQGFANMNKDTLIEVIKMHQMK